MTKRFAIFLVAAAVLAIALAGTLNRQLFTARTASGGDRQLRGSTPLVTFVTVVLGGSRGILADVLWLRATYLQDEGRYFELAQLADWITQLEPHSAEIWSFHAWNMAFNISVLMGSEEERWRWVQNGFRLLRDRAIPVNPDEATLYAELAWIYQQKIGGILDHAHLYYKQRWAVDISTVLPGGLLREEADPDTRRQRESILRERFQLDRDQMIAVDEQFGPLDWRIPESHAVYWASSGRSRRGKGAQLRCERILYQSMATLFFLGRAPATLPPDGFPRRARPDLFSPASRAFVAAMSAYPEDTNVREAYVSFLGPAVLLLHACGDEEQAARALQTFVELSGETGAGSVEAFVHALDVDTLPGGIRLSILQERHFSENREPRG